MIRPLAAALLIAALPLAATFADPQVDFAARNLAPSLAHPFGTDAMGRDLLARTVQGLSLSLRIGLLAAALSTVIAVLVALAANLNRAADTAAGLLTDATLAVPHLVLLILISFALGGGASAIVVAIALSHWPRLARILRAEAMQTRAQPFVETSRALGKSQMFILRAHLLPHLVPQMLTGFLLMLPHAILHEAGLTFLGFGLEPSRPAIGVMLADSMRHIAADRWWLAVFPGAGLLTLALSFETLGNALRRASDPRC